MQTKTVMHSDAGEFWDRRYCEEGAIWGTAPSPTAVVAAEFLAPGGRVLDIGFGYGRDLAFLAQRGFHVAGIDLSGEGQRLAQERLHGEGVEARLWLGRFEDSAPDGAPFDGALSHRCAHLLTTSTAVERFALKARQVLRPGGLLFVGTRNVHDLDPRVMNCVAEGVYEYQQRPGHRIRYWDDQMFRKAFGATFTILSLRDTVEAESCGNPVPCHLTVMIAQSRADAESESAQSANRANRFGNPRICDPAAEAFTFSALRSPPRRPASTAGERAGGPIHASTVVE